jgi:hypothetical protein
LENDFLFENFLSMSWNGQVAIEGWNGKNPNDKGANPHLDAP